MLFGVSPNKQPVEGSRFRQHRQVRNPPRIGRVGLVASDALEMIAARNVLARCRHAIRRHVRMRAQDGVPEQRPESVVLPARIRHHPIQVVEHPPDQQVGVALRWCLGVINRKRVARFQVHDDRIAVADDLIAILKIGQLPAWRARRVEDVLMAEIQPAQPHEREHLQAKRIVVGEAEQLRIGEQRQHSGRPPSCQPAGCSACQCLAISSRVASHTRSCPCT